MLFPEGCHCANTRVFTSKIVSYTNHLPRMGEPWISFPAGWALNLQLSSVWTAQECRLLFAAMEEECWHPLGHVWCCTTQGKRKSLCKLPRTGPQTTYNTTFSIYLFNCFFMSVVTYFDKGEKHQKKRFLPAAGLWRVTASHSTRLRLELLAQWGQLLFCVGGGWCVGMCNSVW